MKTLNDNNSSFTRSQKEDLVRKAIIEASIRKAKKKRRQSIAFIFFAATWLSLVATLVINYADFSKFYFSISYLVLPGLVLFFNRKAMFNDYSRT